MFPFPRINRRKHDANHTQIHAYANVLCTLPTNRAILCTPCAHKHDAGLVRTRTPDAHNTQHDANARARASERAPLLARLRAPPPTLQSRCCGGDARLQRFTSTVRCRATAVQCSRSNCRGLTRQHRRAARKQHNIHNTHIRRKPAKHSHHNEVRHPDECFFDFDVRS